VRAAEPSRVESFDRSIESAIRFDAAAAVHLAPRVGQLQVLGVMHLVGILIAHRVGEVFVEAIVPRTLDESSARRVVVSGRHRHAGAFAHAVDRLDECLAERRFTNDERAIVILQRTRHNFRGAGAAAIRQRHHRNVQVIARFRGTVILVGIRHAPARVHDHRAARQEPVGDLDRLIQRAARIVPQIEDQPLHALTLQRAQRLPEFLIRVLAELGETDVASLRVDHERGRDRRNVNLVSDDRKIDQLIEAAALQRNANRRALRPAKLSHRIVAGPALRLFAFDLPDDVAAPQALLICGRAFKQRHDGDFAIDDGDRDAETVVPPLLTFAHLCVGARVHETGVRIQRLEHPRDGAVHQPVGFDRADVIRLNGVQGCRKDLVLVGNLVLDGKGAAAVEPAHEGAKGDRKHGDGDGTVATHIREMLNRVLDPVQKGFL